MFNSNGNNGAITRVALYARVSSEDQVERETIQNQLQIADTLCPAMGLEIVGRYLDDGISGTVPLEKRPQGALLLEHAHKGMFSQVVVYRLDRIGRTGLVILSAWEALKQQGVGFKSLTEPFDTSQPFGEFVMGILAMVAGYERDSIVSRTTEGRRRKAREGYWTGGRAPLGYKVVDRQLEIDEEEAKLIRRIFRQYTEDRLSGWKIATQLNAEEVPTQTTRRGFTTKKIKEPNHWDFARVLSIIKNETYAGVRHVGKRGKGAIIPQEVPAIIPRETWELAQRLAKSNWSNAPRNAKRDYLLRGLLFCSVCGRRYIGISTLNPYYKCGKMHCSNKHIPANLAEEIIWSDILKFVHNPGPVIDDLREQMGKSDTASIQSELKDVEAAISRLNEERQRILFRIRKALVSDEEGDAQLIATGQERNILEARKAALVAQLQGEEGHRSQLSAAEALLTKLKDKAETADNHTKRQVIETLVAHIAVTVDETGQIKLEPVYRFNPPHEIAYITSIPRMKS